VRVGYPELALPSTLDCPDPYDAAVDGTAT
jgi:hypothetical protein